MITLTNYMKMLAKAEAMPNNAFNRYDRSELIDRLTLNYPNVFKASGCDKGDMIFNRVMNLINA